MERPEPAFRAPEMLGGPGAGEADLAWLEMHLARQPHDLRSHSLRVQLARRGGSREATYGALVDVFIALAERGDLGGASFGFTVPRGGDTWQGERRTLRTVSLKEISVVQAWPAYPDTELALRALRNGSDAERRRRALILAEANKWA